MSAHILVNRIQTPDGTILTSHERHDYQTYRDKNGEKYMVDGGPAYLRRNLCKEPYLDLTVYSDSPHEDKRDAFSWGTYGIDGKQPFKRVLLKDMTTDHIAAILTTQHHISKHVEDMLGDELQFRGIT